MNSHKKIILAGSNGIIGRFLHESLLKDHMVTTISLSKGRMLNNHFSLNLTNKEDIALFAKDIYQSDVLIFLVGLAHKKGNKKDFQEFNKINKDTLMNLLSALKKEKKLPGKIIFASTISVYGEKILQNTYLENSVKDPKSPYAVTKMEAENYLLKYFPNSSWILRFAPVYGADFTLNLNRRTRLGNFFFKVGDGSKKLSLCNIKNLGYVVHSILNDVVPSGTYNVSDFKDYSYNDLLKALGATLVLPIPATLIKVLYYFGKILDNIFLIENTTKLISDNLYPCESLKNYIELPHCLENMKLKKQKTSI